MADSVPSSGDKSGIRPQVGKSAGIDELVRSELCLNLKLPPVTIPNQESEQQSGQTIHFTVQHGTFRLIPLDSGVLLNLMAPETLPSTVDQSSAPEPQTSTVQTPETLPANLPLTNLLLDVMKQSKQTFDKTDNHLQNCSDGFAKAEEEFAKLRTAFLNAIGLEDYDNRDTDNVVLPQTTSKADGTTKSEDQAPAPYHENPHGVHDNDFPFPSPRLAGSDQEELGKINVMLRKIVILLRDMEDNRLIGTQRPYNGEHLNNLYEFTRTDVFEKSMFQKHVVEKFLEWRIREFKKTNPLYIFYQALFELFKGFDETRTDHIHEISCYLKFKNNRTDNLINVEEKILSELNKFVEKRFNDRINKYIEVQGRRYDGEPPQEGDEEIVDWREIIESNHPYQYIPDSPSYKTQELFRSAKKRHEENAGESEKEGYYNLFYSSLSKYSKNKPIINSDFAFFTNNEHDFTTIEQKYIYSILKISDRTNSK